MDILPINYGFRRTLAAVLLMAHAGQSPAEIRLAITGMTEYIGKGFSKSNGDFSGLANLDYQHQSGFYAGVNAAYVDFGDHDRADASHAEITPYAGWTFKLNEDWRFETQWARYLYDGRIFGLESDYNDFSVQLNYRDILTAAVFFSDDYYQRGHTAATYELTGRFPLTDYLEFSAGGGYTQAIETLEYDYVYWNAGLSAYYKFLTFDLRYVDAAASDRIVNSGPLSHAEYYPPPLDPTVLFNISAGF